jgi:3-methyladenine DNA glycosylase AlkC
MFKDLGRLELRDIKDTEAKINKIFKYLDDDKLQLAQTNIIKLLSTPNYFIRELVGKKFVEYHDSEKMDSVVLELIGHKTYGVRAATIFYHSLKNADNPQKIISLINSCWGETPWETEHVIYEMWTKYPEVMKDEMSRWALSEFEKQRALAYHGLEVLSNDDPYYVLRLLEINLNDESIEVQKKISNVITSLIRAKPAECYPYIREWLTDPREQRQKTLFLAVKKLASIALHAHASGKITKSDEFFMLTLHAINDWKTDPDENVATAGVKLAQGVKKLSEEIEAAAHADNQS